MLAAHKPEQLLTCDEPDIFDCREIPAFSRVHDLQQLSPSQQPSKDHLDHGKSRASTEEDRAYDQRHETGRYAEEPRSRRYVMMPDPIEGRSPLSAVRNVMTAKPKPKIHNNNTGPMAKDATSTSVMTKDKTR
jgi:hypothetical protein